MTANRIEARFAQEDRTADRPAVIRMSLDGSDIYVTMNYRRMWANPVFQLAMRILGVRDSNWVSFFKCASWLGLVPIGLALGLSVNYGAPPWTPLLALPIALIYYVYVTQARSRVASELRRREVLLDLYLIPDLDPLEFAAGLALALRHGRRRIASACWAFVAVAMTAGGVALPGAQGLECLVMALVAVVLTLKTAGSVAGLGGRRKFIATYREIREALRPLQTGPRAFLSRPVIAWTSVALLFAAVAVVRVYLQRPEHRTVALLAAFGVFLAFRAFTRWDAASAPPIEEARARIHNTLRNSLYR